MDLDEADPSEFQIFSDLFWNLTCCLAAGLGGSGDDARATTSSLERQGTGGEFHISEFNL